MMMLKKKQSFRLSLSTFLALILFSQASFAQQGPVVYPSQGQSYQQQSQDEGQCRSWAQQQTGFSPYQAAPVYNDSSEGGEVIRGAATGTVLGLIGGAIGDDTGKGAAIGAGVGAGVGLLRKNQNRQSNVQAQQNAAHRHNQQLAQFNRAFATCMQGRGYAVN